MKNSQFNTFMGEYIPRIIMELVANKFPNEQTRAIMYFQDEASLSLLTGLPAGVKLMNGYQSLTERQAKKYVRAIQKLFQQFDVEDTDEFDFIYAAAAFSRFIEMRTVTHQGQDVPLGDMHTALRVCKLLQIGHQPELIDLALEKFTHNLVGTKEHQGRIRIHPRDGYVEYPFTCDSLDRLNDLVGYYEEFTPFSPEIVPIISRMIVMCGELAKENNEPKCLVNYLHSFGDFEILDIYDACMGYHRGLRKEESESMKIVHAGKFAQLF